MNVYYQKAIELKYKGYTYPEISKTIGKKLSVQTLRNLFAHRGLLYIPYCQYVQKMQEFSENKAREEIKTNAYACANILTDLLKAAMEQGKLELAFHITVKMLALAGITEEKSSKPKVEEKHYDSTEQLLAELKERGIDPFTGLPIRAKELLDQGKIKG